MTHNQIDFKSAVETERHNREMEKLTGESQAETARHNKAFEAETNRANLAKESENTRSNQAREKEDNRSNVVNEGIRSAANTINYTLGMLGVTETRRHNTSQEKIDSVRNTYEINHWQTMDTETNRHNVENENNATLNSVLNIVPNQRKANADMLNAKINANLAPSLKTKNYISAIGSLGQTVGGLKKGFTKIKKGVK